MTSLVAVSSRGFTTVSFCVGILNDRLDPTPSPGVRLQPGRTSFRSSSKNAVIGGISSLDIETKVVQHVSSPKESNLTTLNLTHLFHL